MKKILKLNKLDIFKEKLALGERGGGEGIFIQ